MIKTALISIAKKLVTWDKTLAIYKNGEDNAYPERMERFINNSVTASMASNIMVQYLIGKGYGQFDNIKIQQQRFIEIAEDIAEDIVNNKGVFIHVNFDANFDVSDFKVLPFNDCRLGEKDSKEYNGKILVSKQWSEKKIDKSKVQILNVYNPDKKVLEYQIEKAGGLDKYNGQVFYFNCDRKYYYPLSRIDSVALDCDNENQASIYKNEILRRGFFGKTLVVTRPLIHESFIDDESAEGIKKLRQLESEREQFKETIKDFISVGNVGGVLHMEVDFAGDDINNAILFKNIESNINDKLFEYTEKSCVEKILMAFNNLPIALVKSPDSALLGNSGEALKEAQKIYWKNTNKERSIIEGILTEFYNRINPENKIEIKVIPLVEDKIDEDSALVEKQKAQATLKGSVGGVQALLEIQQAVSSGLADYESAIAIISEIYGISDELARKMLGTPKTTETI
jgi:hypothetical protein